MNTELYPHQVEALKKMHNGCILCGKVGSGKSRTALAYIYICELGGSLRINGEGEYTKPELPKDVYIITTAKKRDTHEWEGEAAYFCLQSYVNVTIDSWNNIKKYKDVHGAVFIFDEQRVVGRGAWVKAFLNITRKNRWILLSATPGDKWEDYIPVFIANGFYRSRSQFKAEHMVMKPYLKYDVVDHYIGLKRLKFYSRMILVPMEFEHAIAKHKMNVMCEFNRDKYKRIMKDRWNIYENEPINDISSMCYLLRRVCNSDESRAKELIRVFEHHKNVIVFYNYDYELEILRKICDETCTRYAEWNGHKHEPVPEDGNLGWAYLCQYAAASEGWNCITSDTIVFFSQNYSYKTTEQAAGRIDRLNTPFEDLYYYYFRSTAPIDISIYRALSQKKKFNEARFMKGVSFTSNAGVNRTTS